MMAESPVATELMKRLRALKKKLSRVGAIEDVEDNKRNKEQIALLATKGDIECSIRELEAFKSKLDSLNLLDGDGPSREMNNCDNESINFKKARPKKEAVDEVKAAPSDLRASKVVQLRVVASEGPDCTYQQVEIQDSLTVKDLVDCISHAEKVPVSKIVDPDGTAQSKVEAAVDKSARTFEATPKETVAKANAQAADEALHKLAMLMVVLHRYPTVATARSNLAGKMPQLAALIQGENSSLNFAAAVDASAAACKAFVSSKDKYEMVGDVAAVASLRSKVSELAHRLKTSQLVPPPAASAAQASPPGPDATSEVSATEPTNSLPSHNEPTVESATTTKPKRNRKKRGGRSEQDAAAATPESMPMAQPGAQGSQVDEKPEYYFTFGEPGTGLEEGHEETNNLEAFEEPTFTFGAVDDDDVGPYSTVAQPSPPPPDRKSVADTSSCLMGPPPFAQPAQASSGLVLPPYGGPHHHQQQQTPPLSYLGHNSSMGMGMGLGMQPGVSTAMPHHYGGGAPAASAAASTWSQPSHSLPMDGSASSSAWPSSGNAAVVDSLFSASEVSAEPAGVTQQQQQQPSLSGAAAPATAAAQPGEGKGAKKSRKKKPKPSSGAPLQQEASAPNLPSGAAPAAAPSSNAVQAPTKPTPLPSAASSPPAPEASAPAASKRNRGKKRSATASVAAPAVEPKQEGPPAVMPQEASNDQKKSGSQRRKKGESKNQGPSQNQTPSDLEGKAAAPTQEPAPGKGSGSRKAKASNKAASIPVGPSAPAAASSAPAQAPSAPVPSRGSAGGHGEAKKGTRAAPPANSAGDSAKEGNGKSAKGKGHQPRAGSNEAAGKGENSKGGKGASAGQGDRKGGTGGKGGGKGGKGIGKGKGEPAARQGKGSNRAQKNGWDAGPAPVPM